MDIEALCECRELGQPETPFGIMHHESCKWLAHPMGGNFQPFSTEAKLELIEMLVEQDEEGPFLRTESGRIVRGEDAKHIAEHFLNDSNYLPLPPEEE